MLSHPLRAHRRSDEEIIARGGLGPQCRELEKPGRDRPHNNRLGRKRQYRIRAVPAGGVNGKWGRSVATVRQTVEHLPLEQRVP